VNSYRHAAQASVFWDSLAGASCLYLGKFLSAARLVTANRKPSTDGATWQESLCWKSVGHQRSGRPTLPTARKPDGNVTRKFFQVAIHSARRREVTDEAPGTRSASIAVGSMAGLSRLPTRALREEGEARVAAAEVHDHPTDHHRRLNQSTAVYCCGGVQNVSGQQLSHWNWRSAIRLYLGSQ